MITSTVGGDLEDLFAPWYQAVLRGLAGCAELADSDPDYGTPRQIARDALANSELIGDFWMRFAVESAAAEVLAEIDGAAA